MSSDSRLEEIAYLRSMKARLARLFHDMNNPLAVASGNLQFVAELEKMGETEGLGDAVADTGQALRKLEALMNEFLELRAEIDRRILVLDDSGE